MPAGVKLVFKSGKWYFDYTTPINNALERNVGDFFAHRIQYSYAEYIERYRTPYYIPSFADYLAIEVMPKGKWFVQQVNNEKPWDLKLPDPWNETINEGNTKVNAKYYSQRFPFVYEGEIIDAEKLGNITYGYLGSAMGFSSSVLQTEGSAVGFFVPSKEDQEMTNWGIELFFSRGNNKNKYPVKF